MKQNNSASIIFAILLFSTTIVDFTGVLGKRGGTISRGGSPTRAGGGGFGGGSHTPVGGGGAGLHPSAGGPKPVGPGGGMGMGGGHFGGPPPRPGTFSSAGSGLGSASRASSFKTALIGGAAGALGGLVAFEAGKAILHSFDKPFHHGNNDYYFDERYAKAGPGKIVCQMPLENLIQANAGSTPSTTSTPTAENATQVAGSAVPATQDPNKILSELQFPNGTKPRYIVFTCRQNAEVCCGMDCCPAPTQQFNGAAHSSGGPSFGQIVLIILALYWSFSLADAVAAFSFTNVAGRRSSRSCLLQ